MAAAVALVPEGGPLIIVGHSAGGQLALYAATRRSADAVVALAPVADLHLAQELALSSDAASELMGGVPDEVGDRYDRTSPTRLVPLGAPILVLFGQDDDVVPTVLGERFVEAARAAGDIADLLVLEAIDHMDVIDPVSRAWRAAVAWVAGRVGELPPPDFC